MSLTCILFLVLGLLLGGIVGLWSVRKDGDDTVVVVEENPSTSSGQANKGTTSVKEGEKKDDNVIQLGGDSKSNEGKKNK